MQIKSNLLLSVKRFLHKWMFVEAANSKILFCRARGVFRNPHGFEQYFFIMSTSGANVGTLSNFKDKATMSQLVKEVSPLRQNYVCYELVKLGCDQLIRILSVRGR